ncbi:MAG: ABC transporter ATP-binding protein [Lachnospiraceae bacterium]
MIEVNHLTKKYGNHYAVNDLSFTVEKGQIYGFLGPNGAGKSTTMNIITGYLAATSGEIKVNGFDIMKQPEEAKKCIGYLPELPPLYPDMTVSEYLKFVAELKKVKKEERKQQIKEVMEVTHIDDMQNRLIKNLSKGYKQRVGLAQAMIGNPEIIILDEPTVGLDPKQIIEIRDLIKSLKEKHTVILSSHILSEVSAVCDHIMIISKGKLVASDSPEELGKRMQGENEIEIAVKGEKEKLQQVLSDIQGIDSFTIEATEEEELTKAVIKVSSHEEIREALFYRLAKEELPIYKMVLNTKSLEDIFLELTSDDEEEKPKEEEESC